MAFLYVRGNRAEIRETRTTRKGPRSRTLASFSGALSPDLLDQADARASGPLDREALLASARRKGVPVTAHRRDPVARDLLARLQRGDPIDPTLVALLRSALAALPATPLPEHLAEASEWIGRSEAAHGKALRGLLRTFDRIVRARGPLARDEADAFPRFRSEPLEAS